jgi:hypothetical protein
MILASGCIASWPSSASSSLTRCAGVSLSGKLAMMRPVSEMSYSFIVTPAVRTKASTIGSSENVASPGASSTLVQTISRSDMLTPLGAGLVSAEFNYQQIRRFVASACGKGKPGAAPRPRHLPEMRKNREPTLSDMRPVRTAWVTDYHRRACPVGSTTRRRRIFVVGEQSVADQGVILLPARPQNKSPDVW